MAHHRDSNTDWSSSGRCPLEKFLLEVTIDPTIGPTGEGNGNPLQCSRLENPRDEEAGWAAIYGVTQSRIRLKRLSSSSIGPIDFRAGLPQTKQQTGREHNPSHQEINGLKFY